MDELVLKTREMDGIDTHWGGPNGSEGEDATEHEGNWTECKICRGPEANSPTPDNFDNMTRRDWLAGLAMQGMLSGENARDTFDQMVSDAYSYADAMIEEGKK